MKLKIFPHSTKMLVEQSAPQDMRGNIMVVGETSHYSKGVVLDVGIDVLKEFVGKTIVYPTNSAKVVGLGFPKEYVLVDEEDVHALIEDE